MNEIRFTRGEISKLDESYFTLKLFNLDELVYTATITLADADDYMLKHSNINILN